MRVYFSAIILASLLFFALADDRGLSFRNLASVFFQDSITEAGLKETFQKARNGNGKVKILIVPGHDYESPGTSFGALQEVELTTALGAYLYEFLRQDPAFEVMLARNENGYHPLLAQHFEKKAAISAFIREKAAIMKNLVQAGEVGTSILVHHNYARPEAAQKLQAINHWANENQIHIVLHLHFNDAPGRRQNQPGKYAGVAVYVPENQYSNAKVSKAIAHPIFARLARWYPISNLPLENQGIIPDQELIAIGSNNTLDAAGLLIEYGYIYEPRILAKELRKPVLKDLAFQTYRGIQDFFAGMEGVPEIYFLPHAWTRDIFPHEKLSPHVLALQAALAKEGLYPPEGETKHDCPITGNMGPCTRTSLKQFKAKHGLADEMELLGPKTRAALNGIHGK